MVFKTMKAEDIFKAIEGHENVLGPASRKMDDMLKNMFCPSCHAKAAPFLDPKHLFREGELLPHYLGRCTECNCEFDPQSGIQVTP